MSIQKRMIMKWSDQKTESCSLYHIHHDPWRSMMKQENLDTLLKDLGFRTPFDEIQPSLYNTISQFLQTEKEYRKQYKIKWLLRTSGIKQVKSFEHFDWHFNPKIPKEDVLIFKSSPWIEDAFNLVLIGDTGLGKSHISASLCYEAILKGYPTIFITAFDLTSKIKRALNPVTKIDYYAKIRVLCIDELGYTYHKKEDTDILFQIISKDWGPSYYSYN